MRLLLDENVPVKIKRDILGFNLKNIAVSTVTDQGWKGKKNGELLKSMLSENFDALITADKNIQHQQNFEKYPIPVLVLQTQRLTYGSLSKLMPKLKSLLNTQLSTGVTIIK